MSTCHCTGAIYRARTPCHCTGAIYRARTPCHCTGAIYRAPTPLPLYGRDLSRPYAFATVRARYIAPLRLSGNELSSSIEPCLTQGRRSGQRPGLLLAFYHVRVQRHGSDIVHRPASRGGPPKKILRASLGQTMYERGRSMLLSIEETISSTRGAESGGNSHT